MKPSLRLKGVFGWHSFAHMGNRICTPGLMTTSPSVTVVGLWVQGASSASEAAGQRVLLGLPAVKSFIHIPELRLKQC